MHSTENKYKQGQYLLALLMIALLVSCDNTPKHPARTVTAGEKTLKRTGSSFSETLVVNFPAAVFYCPDSLQLQKMKAVTDPAAFDGIMHEYEYLMKNAERAIRKTLPRLQIVQARNMRYLLFIRADNRKVLIDLDTQAEPCGLLVFNRQKAPQLLDMSNIETGLEFYFFR